MPNDDDPLALLVAGGLGYLLGQGQYADWQPIIEQYQKRLSQLSYLQIPLPWGYMDAQPNMTIVYRESIACFLFGLPNSCLPTLMRLLEQALILKYTQVEGKKPPNSMSLAELIDWGEKFLHDKTSSAHSFRMLRNFVHTDKLVQEQDCLEGIRHVSIIVEKLFPGHYAGTVTTCKNCGNTAVTDIDTSLQFLASNFQVTCARCRRNFNWIMLP
jgi:hypothetical protein